MDQRSPYEVTRVLEEVGRGDARARTRLLALVYDELHQLAAGQMRAERRDHTLQPTALVHEAYMRLFGGADLRFESRAHFYGAAAEVMRRILVDHARARSAAKRGGDRAQVALERAAELSASDPEEVLAVDEALGRLAAIDPERSRLVELRFFAGLDLEEIAELLGVSVPTVKRRWRYAKAWLYREIGGT